MRWSGKEGASLGSLDWGIYQAADMQSGVVNPSLPGLLASHPRYQVWGTGTDSPRRPAAWLNRPIRSVQGAASSSSQTPECVFYNKVGNSGNCLISGFQMALQRGSNLSLLPTTLSACRSANYTLKSSSYLGRDRAYVRHEGPSVRPGTRPGAPREGGLQSHTYGQSRQYSRKYEAKTVFYSKYTLKTPCTDNRSGQF